MKTVAIAAVVLLSASWAGAEQRRHHAPSRPAAASVAPERIVPQVLSTTGKTILPPPPPASPFDARPGTYKPRYNDPSPHSGRHGDGVPVYGGGFGIGSYLPLTSDEVTAPIPVPADADQKGLAPVAPEPPRAPEPVREPEPQHVVAHGPDTFYVIPGCYAGNRPPTPARLPKGCDVARMKTTSVR